jgi:hypothetical protein
MRPKARDDAPLPLREGSFPAELSDNKETIEPLKLGPVSKRATKIKNIAQP